MANSAPKVSVVVPNYNYARYLGERIGSILSQTFRDYELIILDDGSSDDSVAVIGEYAAADERIRTELFDENGGKTFRCHQRGAELARGDYLMWAEADDSCHPALLERLVAVLDAHRDVGRVSAATLVLSDTQFDAAVKSKQQESVKTAAPQLPSRESELNRISVGNCVTHVSSVLVRRATYAQTSGFNTQLAISADWQLWWECALVADAAYLPAVLNYRRVHAQSASDIGDWESAKAATLEDANLASYFVNHPRARGVLTANTLQRIRRRRARWLWRILNGKVRSWRELRELAPAYYALRRIDRYAEFRIAQAACALTARGMRRRAVKMARTAFLRVRFYQRQP